MNSNLKTSHGRLNIKMEQNKPAILYVIKNTLNSMKYYGMIHKKGKTITERLQDHIAGKRSGKHIHAAIQQLGKEHFFIEEIERGAFAYIAQREIDEAKKSLYVDGNGYNGNCGKCILFNAEMLKRKFANTDQTKRVAKWKQTYNNRRHLHNYSRSEEYIKKQEETNYSKVRGKNKDNTLRLAKQSESLKKRFRNPSEAMIKGMEKRIITQRSQTKINSERVRKRSDTLKSRGTFAGKNNPSFKGYWVTPFGKYELAIAAAESLNISLSTLKTWCNKNKVILKRFHKNNSNILEEWNNKLSRDVGFYIEPNNL